MVYLHLANGFEEIEALTVVDVLRRAGIDVKTVSVSDDRQITGAHEISVLADILYENANYSNCEMIVLPGGMPGTKNLAAHAGLEARIKEFAEDGKWIAAICAAPMILGNLSLLKGKKATIFSGMEEHLIGAEFSKERVVVDGNFVTSRGAGTAMDFSLKLVELLKDEHTAATLRKAMLV
ncbi:DJ-1 family glyoxalase III [Sinanaerobacter chloroacetimidivorans]|uniref:DJ-1/PfpI family protein n=1 Tax=Sinanaerobacter chloroacetimidivorans TaxID=2818044 RepID=A0A8J8B0T7_9FIRM|nr:DJ-1 family glyoxalase III [Sinanaerobacter chloroacetimidivorans]MBR0597504.1 DJ-1/PfpI family protein [Sinanaerobacter chloroacetimidivorans]